MKNRFYLLAMFLLAGTSSFAQDDSTDDDWSTTSGETTTTSQVGIGTTSPAGELHVDASVVSTSDPLLFLSDASATNSGFKFKDGTGNSNSFVPTIETIGIGTGATRAGLLLKSWLGEDGSDDMGVRFIAVNASGGDLTTAASYGWYNNATEQMRLSAGGNLGIGVSSPAEKLDVDGNVQLEGKVILSQDGTHSSEIAPVYNSATGIEADDIHINSSTGIVQLNKAGKNNVLHINNNAGSGRFSIFGSQFAQFSGSYYTMWFDGGVGNSYIRDGHLGIGTTTPSARLDVNVNSASGTTDVPLAQFTAHTSSNGTSGDAGTLVIGRSSTPGDASTYISSEDETTSGLGFKTRNSTGIGYRMVIDNDGDVGIGVTTPESKLHVVGDQTIETSGVGNAFDIKTSSDVSYLTVSNQNSETDPTPKMAFRWGSTTSSVAAIAAGGAGMSIRNYYNGNGGTITFQNHVGGGETIAQFTNGKQLGIGMSPTEALDVAGNIQATGNLYIDGQVEIGDVTNFPAGYKMVVDGKIGAEAVKVDADGSTWGDFVFENDYELLPLDSLNEFVGQEKHLPGIPTADMVDREGIDLGEMQRLQMIKIEELTLYVLELSKENKELKKQIEQIQSDK